MEKNIRGFFRAIFRKSSDENYLFRYDGYVLHRLWKIHVCRLQRIGTREFYFWTPHQIIHDEEILNGMRGKDVLLVERLYQEEQRWQQQCVVKEFDHKGSIVLENSEGEQHRYAEKLVLLSEELIAKLSSKEAAQLGYRVGVRETLSKTSCRRGSDFVSSLIGKSSSRVKRWL